MHVALNGTRHDVSWLDVCTDDRHLLGPESSLCWQLFKKQLFNKNPILISDLFESSLVKNEACQAPQ